MTSNSLQLLLAVRAERRANELTFEALFREVFASLLSALSTAFHAVANSYVAFSRRQARRRHHYRRAVNAVSRQRLAADASRLANAGPLPKPADTPRIHFVPGSTRALPNEVVPSLPEAAKAPPAYVCAESLRQDAREKAV